MSLAQLLHDFDAAQKAFSAQAQEAMKAAFREVFEQFPEITAFRWCQYTPYFNDGEPCEFRMGEIYFGNLPIGDDVWDDIRGYGEYDGEREDIYTYGEEGRDLPFFWVSNTSGTSYRTNKPTGPTYFDQKDLSKFNALLSALQSDAMESVMKGTFGDHVVVTATRDGFDVEEYDHD